MTQKKLNIILLTVAIIVTPHWILQAYAEKASNVPANNEQHIRDPKGSLDNKRGTKQT